VKHRRVTIKQVAEEAGVSITTVSHVLNDVPGLRVNPGTRQRIQDVSARLGYVPNRLAQSLRTRRSNTIGLIGDEIVTTPFAGKLVLGAQEVALTRDTVMFVVSTGYERDVENRQIEELLRRQVDGILYASMFHRKLDLPEQLESVPTVFLNAECTTAGVPWVAPDEIAGGRDAAEVLIEAGHRRLGFINNIDDIPASTGRLEGFRARMLEAGLPADALTVLAVESDAPGGYAAALRLLGGPDRPTGVFCFNDRVAMGAYRAAAELGLRIPQDVSIVGFDDQEYVADSAYPGLTTIALPHYEMGAWAAQKLFKKINGTTGDTPTALLRGPVVHRGSVAPPSVH
jgi:LacI family transcriptional regulator